MNIEQLLEKTSKSEELQEQLTNLLEQGDKEAVGAWVKEQGCDATLTEIKQYLAEKGEELKDSGELTPEQLEAAAGGTDAVLGVVITVSIAFGGVAAGVVASNVAGMITGGVKSLFSSC